ncbi:MAG: AbrB/MazE/SpoVT family DNA-binding domain-containing protein [Halobacteria archaeon]
MRLPLVKVGNSLSLRIPRRVLASLGLREGGGLFLSTEGNDMVLSKTPKHPKIAAFMEAIRPLLGKEVLLVYLFGSFVTPKFKADRSDIDLFVVVRDERAQTKVIEISAELNIRMRGTPLSTVAIALSDVSWVWFEDEVASGFPLYVDPVEFPHGVPPLEYLYEVEGVETKAEANPA